MAQSNIAFLWAIEEPSGDVFAIPLPPAPLESQQPRRARVRWSRRLVLGLGNLAAWAILGGILCAIGVFR
jgi:hypothetical protein